MQVSARSILDLIPNLVKSRSREIGCYNDRIALKFDRHLGSGAAEVPVKFHSNWPEKPNVESRGFETSRDLVVRRPSAYSEYTLSVWLHYNMGVGDVDCKSNVNH